MATYLENLTTARDNYASILASISASPKPSYNVEGQAFSWTEYQKFLTEMVSGLNTQIAAGEPFEFVTEGTT